MHDFIKEIFADCYDKDEILNEEFELIVLKSDNSYHPRGKCTYILCGSSNGLLIKRLYDDGYDMISYVYLKVNKNEPLERTEDKFIEFVAILATNWKTIKENAKSFANEYKHKKEMYAKCLDDFKF
jgi:3-dehydroquinate synthase class II